MARLGVLTSRFIGIFGQTRKPGARFGALFAVPHTCDVNATERPQEVETRATLGHWEIDTVQGSSDTHCILTVVERKTGYVLLGKLPNKPKQATEQRAVQLMRRHRQKMHTSTSDHGTEFHSYRSQRSKQVYCFTLRLPTILGSEAVMNMPME